MAEPVSDRTGIYACGHQGLCVKVQEIVQPRPWQLQPFEAGQVVPVVT